MFPAFLTSFPVGLSFDWGSFIPLSMVVALLVSGAGVLHAALVARRRPRLSGVRLPEVIPVSSETVAESQHSTIAA